MLHPDKASGQQAHDTTRVSVILGALLFGIFLGVVSLPIPAIAETAVLKEIRMGDHGKYTRVVFEFSAPVQYQLSENTAAGSVSIRFLETTSSLPGTPVSNTPDCIDTMSTIKDGSNTIANILFDPKGVKLNPFMIKAPDRVVLDIFCEEEPVVTAALPETRGISEEEPVATAALPETRDITEEEPVVTATLPETRDITEEEPVATAALPETRDITAEEPVVTAALPETRDIAPAPNTAAEPLPDKPLVTPPLVKDTPTLIFKEPSSKKDYSQKYLLLLLAAITGIIVLVIALIIFQRRNLLENHVAGNLDATHDTDDMMHAIDTKIKEKLMKYDE